jgi:hypothetical protein
MYTSALNLNVQTRAQFNLFSLSSHHDCRQSQMRQLFLWLIFFLMVLCPLCRKNLPGTDRRGLAVHQSGTSCRKKKGGLANILKKKAKLQQPKTTQVPEVLPVAGHSNFSAESDVCSHILVFCTN